MKLERFKEKDNKRIGIIVFTIICILLVCGAVLYRTFAIFEVKTNQNMINGEVQSMGDLRFMVYVEGELQKDMPNKESEYSLDTSKSYCEDITDSSKKSHINWNQEKWSIEIKDIGTTKTKCYLYFDKLYVDSILNGAIPDLGNELVAITFNEENGHAVKANLTSEWYNYSTQKWANAVILRRKEDYAAGEVIPEENIESYFVWIPRYEYEIWNGEEETNRFTAVEENLGEIPDATQNEKLNKQQSINIKFVNKNVPIVTGSTKDSWLTHPAFVSFDCNGFWVGKFETGYNQNDDVQNLNTNGWTTKKAEKDTIASDRVIIKSNVYSWRGIRVANAFYTSYNYKRELDSHMMKNMEWGALAYLTNSKYGRCNGNCTEVRINNSSSFVTGSSAVKEPHKGYDNYNTDTGTNELHADIDGVVVNYENLLSVISSTTNNYYGVYDTAGGAWEYVMGVMVDEHGKPASGRNDLYNSNFIGTLTCPTCDERSKEEWIKEDNGMEWPDTRYYDIYNYDTTTWKFQRGHLGDATKEMGPFYTINTTRYVSEWYSDDAFFVGNGVPWFVRGGVATYGVESGTTAFAWATGATSAVDSFRIVLTP